LATIVLFTTTLADGAPDDAAMISGAACPGSRCTGANPKCCRSVSGVNTAPHAAHENASGGTSPPQLWHTPSRFATPGVRPAKFQNCRVVGPRITVSFASLPRFARSRIVSNEHPGLNGALAFRINHGPIEFCDAWRESGSKCPLHASHRLGFSDTCPQYGHRIPRGPERGSIGWAGRGEAVLISGSGLTRPRGHAVMVP